MRFLVDRCAGRRLADWLRAEGHDVAEVSQRGPDPGDRAVLAWAVGEGRILVTLDSDFGTLIFQGQAHMAVSFACQTYRRQNGSRSSRTY